MICAHSLCFSSKHLHDHRGRLFCSRHLVAILQEENDLLSRNLSNVQERSNSLITEARAARAETIEARLRMQREIDELERQLVRKTAELVAAKTTPLFNWPNVGDMLHDIAHG